MIAIFSIKGNFVPVSAYLPTEWIYLVMLPCRTETIARRHNLPTDVSTPVLLFSLINGILYDKHGAEVRGDNPTELLL